jgi:hypothetical protein
LVPEAALLFAVSQEKGQLKKNNLGWGNQEEKPLPKHCLAFSGEIPGRIKGHKCSPVVPVEGVRLLPLVGHSDSRIPVSSANLPQET